MQLRSCFAWAVPDDMMSIHFPVLNIYNHVRLQESTLRQAMKGQCQAAVPAPPIPIPEPNGAFQQTGPAGQAQGQERRQGNPSEILKNL